MVGWRAAETAQQALAGAFWALFWGMEALTGQLAIG